MSQMTFIPITLGHLRQALKDMDENAKLPDTASIEIGLDTDDDGKTSFVDLYQCFVMRGKQ